MSKHGLWSAFCYVMDFSFPSLLFSNWHLILNLWMALLSICQDARLSLWYLIQSGVRGMMYLYTIRIHEPSCWLIGVLWIVSHLSHLYILVSSQFQRMWETPEFCLLFPVCHHHHLGEESSPALSSHWAPRNNFFYLIKFSPLSNIWCVKNQAKARGTINNLFLSSYERFVLYKSHNKETIKIIIIIITNNNNLLNVSHHMIMIWV